jgi:RNA polymerase subunit RPABC4/transcription elongation factor Spt4
MKTCHICGAAILEKERVCPTCGNSATADPYAPGEALVAEVPPESSGVALSSEDYGVKLGLEAVLTKALNLWAGSLGTLVVTQILWIVVSLPFIIVFFIMAATGELHSSNPRWGLAGLLIFFGLAIVPAATVSQSAALLVLEDRARGREPSLSALSALRGGVRFIGRLLLAGIGIGALAVLSFVPAFVLLLYQEWALGFFAFFPSLAVCFYIWIWAVPLQSVLVIDDLALGPGLRRTGELLRGCKWRVLGYNVMGWLVIATLSGALGFVGLVPILGQIITLTAQLLLMPLWYSIFFSLYAALSDRRRASIRPG